MATRIVTGVVKRPNGSAWDGGEVRFRLTPDTFRSSPTETYPEDTVRAVADASGSVAATLISGADVVYEVTLPSGDRFGIAVPDGSATTIEALRASYSGAPAAVDSVEAALIALYGSPPTGRAPIAVQASDVTVVAEAAYIDFDAAAFAITESPAGEANVALAAQAIDWLSDVAISGVVDGHLLRRGSSLWGNEWPVPAFLPLLLPTQPQVTWTNMPVAATAFAGDAANVLLFTLSQARQVHLSVWNGTAGAAASELFVQTSPDGSTWTDTGCAVSIATQFTHNSGWVNLPTASRIDPAFIGVFGRNGDGVADPTFRRVFVQAR